MVCVAIHLIHNVIHYLLGYSQDEVDEDELLYGESEVSMVVPEVGIKEVKSDDSDQQHETVTRR